MTEPHTRSKRKTTAAQGRSRLPAAARDSRTSAEEDARGGPARTPGGALAAPTALASYAQTSATSPDSVESSQETRSHTPEEPLPLAPSEPAAGAGASELAATDDTAQMLSHELSTEMGKVPPAQQDLVPMAVQTRQWPKWADLKAALSRSGLVVSAKPDEAALKPGSADGKQLVGRSILYHWTDLGWCSGIIKKANGDTSKTVDGDVISSEIYYEVDDDLSHHVLDLALYVPDGPANSWVLLQEPVMAEPPANPAQGEASGEDGAGDGDGGCGGVCWVSVEGAKPGWWPARIIGAFPQAELSEGCL